MAEVLENRRLNKFIKQNLIRILSVPGVDVRFIGDDNTFKCLMSEYYTGYDPIEVINPYVFVVSKQGKKIFEYKHSKSTVSVYVEDTCVANVEAPAFGNPDIQELKDALVGKVIQAKKEKLIVIDRKHMMYYEIRAMELLKQYQK